MNEVIKAMKERRSIRKFKAEMPSKADLEQIVEAGLYAANGRGRQAVITIAVTDKELRDKLSAVNNEIMGGPEGNDPFYGAPAILIVLANKEVPTATYDGSLVMGNLMLAAYAVGLGSCWINRAKEMFESAEGKALMKEWGIADTYAGVACCILGYADGPLPEAKPRKNDYIVRV